MNGVLNEIIYILKFTDEPNSFILPQYDEDMVIFIKSKNEQYFNFLSKAIDYLISQNNTITDISNELNALKDLNTSLKQYILDSISELITDSNLEPLIKSQVELQTEHMAELQTENEYDIYINNLSEHQYNSLIKTCDYFKSGKTKGIWNLFCRYGKTRLSVLFCHKMDFKNILVLVPSIYLVEQTYKEWINYFDDQCIVKISCKEDYNNKLNDIITTNGYIIICVYNSSLVVADINFDICIYDEAHRTAISKHYSENSDDSDTKDNSYNQLLLQSDKIARKLFLTATLKENTGAFSMDNEDIYGEIILKVSALEAKKLKRLNDYKLLCITINDNITNDDKKIISLCIKNIREFTDNKNKITEELLYDYLRIAKSLLGTIAQYNIKHVITFHKYIYRCKIFKYIVDLLISNNTHSNFISGNNNLQSRNSILDLFQSTDGSILCSAKVLQEGVDIPLCDAVCFVDTKTSVVDTIQSLSRCLTYNENKQMAYIILPFFNDSKIKNDERTNDLRIIIKNLIECDDNIREYFDGLKNKSVIHTPNDNDETLIDPNSLTSDLNNISVIYNVNIFEQLNSISYDTYVQARDKVHKKYKSINEYKSNILNDFNNDVPLNPEIIYKRLGWKGWKEYIGTDIDEIKPIVEPHNKCRDIIKCVRNGQRVLHSINNKDGTGKINRIGIYNNGTITCDGKIYYTLNLFAQHSFKIHRPERDPAVNAWKDCKLEMNGSWISMDNLPLI